MTKEIVDKDLSYHKQQALSYLQAAGLHLVKVIVYGPGRVQSARIVNTIN